MMNRLTITLASALLLSASLPASLAVAQQERDDPPKADRDQQPKADRDQQKNTPAQESGNRQGEREDKNRSERRKASQADSDKAKARSDRDETQPSRGAERQGQREDDDKSRQAGSQKKRDTEQTKEASEDQSEDSVKRRETRDASDRKDADRKDKGNRDAAADRDKSTSPDTAGDKNRDDRRQQARDGDDRLIKAKNVDLSGDKKERVKQSLKSENITEVTNVDIDVRVGRRLPRDWSYRPVPRAVLEIVPEYEGYRYVYVENRYVIVEPDTYEVVYVLDESGGAATGRSTGEAGSGATVCATSLTFTEDDREFIYERVHKTGVTLQLGPIEIGTSIPDDARVEVFPSEVTRRVSVLENCRFAVVGERVAVIDPSGDKIVAIIED